MSARGETGGDSPAAERPAGPGAESPAAPAVSSSVVLVGFMGSGKSHVGKLLSRVLGLPLVDTDRLIESENGPLEEIFAARGEEAFRALERRVVLDTLAGLPLSPAVVSLGGGALSDGDVRAALRAAPYVAWLSAPVDVLWRRAQRAARRGGVRPLARDEASFRVLYEKRLPWYREVATAEFRNDGDHSAAEVAELVARSLQEAA